MIRIKNIFIVVFVDENILIIDAFSFPLLINFIIINNIRKAITHSIPITQYLEIKESFNCSEVFLNMAEHTNTESNSDINITKTEKIELKTALIFLTLKRYNEIKLVTIVNTIIEKKGIISLIFENISKVIIVINNATKAIIFLVLLIFSFENLVDVIIIHKYKIIV